MKRRFYYITILIVAGVLGYSSRYFSGYLPFFIAEYAGDTFWAFALYYLVKSIFPGYLNIKTALFTYLFSVIIEVSQFYKAPWIDKFRNTFIGGLMLGFGFHLEDLLCYAVGVLMAIGLDYLIFKQKD